MAYKLEWMKDARKDYQKLDGSQKIQIDKGLNKIIEKGMQAGKGLQGNLSQCREIKHRRLGLRIIFTCQSDKQLIEVIEIIVIGQRSDEQVYQIAAKRFLQ